jgi:hypothetical protein
MDECKSFALENVRYRELTSHIAKIRAGLESKDDGVVIRLLFSQMNLYYSTVTEYNLCDFYSLDPVDQRRTTLPFTFVLA